MEVWRKPVELFIDQVSVNEQMVCFYLCDGRTVSLSLSKFSLFEQAGYDELREYQLADDARSVTWPLLNITISLDQVLSLTNPAF